MYECLCHRSVPQAGDDLAERYEASLYLAIAGHFVWQGDLEEVLRWGVDCSGSYP